MKIQNLKYSFFPIGASLAFVIFSIALKYLASLGFNSLFICLFYGLFSTIIMFAIKYLQEKNLAFLKINKREFLLSFVVAGIMGIFIVDLMISESLKFIQIGIQRLITNSSPLINVVLLYLFIRKKPTKWDILSSISVMVGLLLVIGKININNGTSFLTGCVYAFISMIALAVYSTVLDVAPTKLDDYTFWFYAYLGFTVASCIIMLFNINQFNNVFLLTPYNIFILCFTALLGFTFASFLFVKSFKHFGVVNTSIIVASSPIISIILDVFLYGQTMNKLQLLGAVLVLAPAVISIKKE